MAKKIFSELKLAQQQDPDNALYNYLAAGLLLEKACKSDSKRIDITPKDKKSKKEYKTEYSFKIKDRKLLNQALEEYLDGTRKKYFKTYLMDINNKRFAIMGQPQSLIENIRQIAVSAGILLPYLQYLRDIPRSLWLYAETLQKEGRQREALRIIAPWKTYIKQITEDAYCLIDVLVDGAIAAIGKQKIPEIYRKAKKIKLADNAEQELLNIYSPIEKFKANARKYKPSLKLLGRAGIFAGMLLPALGKMDYTEEDLAISNKIEYTALEKAGVVLLNFLFLLGMTGGLLTALFWRIRSGEKALLLAPSARLIGKNFLWGIVLPLTAYVLISISGIVGGHEYNLVYNAISLGAQLIILFTVIPATIFVLVRKHVHQRCLELNIACPEIRKSKVWRIIIIAVFSISTLFILLPVKMYPKPSRPELSFMLVIIIGSCAVLLLISYILVLIAEYIISLSSGKQYALYYGALAKTLTPVFALAMIFMTLLVIPYLDWREADLIGKDKILYGQPKSFTHAEYKVTQRLKAAMLKALE